MPGGLDMLYVLQGSISLPHGFISCIEDCHTRLLQCPLLRKFLWEGDVQRRRSQSIGLENSQLSFDGHDFTLNGGET